MGVEFFFEPDSKEMGNPTETAYTSKKFRDLDGMQTMYMKIRMQGIGYTNSIVGSWLLL